VPIITPFLETFDKVPIQKCGSRNRSGCEKVCRTSAVAEAEVCCNTIRHNKIIEPHNFREKGKEKKLPN
jgi:hypothetical protein